LVYIPVISRIAYAFKSIELFYEPKNNNSDNIGDISVKNIQINTVNSTVLHKYTSGINYTNIDFDLEQMQGTFSPALYYNGYDLDNNYITDVKWYYRNNKVNYSQEGVNYDPLAGYGWSKINTDLKDLLLTIDKTLKYTENYCYLNIF
jgi:hypothetical protein